MKRRITKLLLVAIACFCFVGCQKKDDAVDAAQDKIEKEETEGTEETTESTELTESKETYKGIVFEDKLQEWQVNYAKILVEWLENSKYTGRDLRFELLDLDEDGIPELYACGAFFTPDGECQGDFGGINKETNEVVLYEEYNIYEPQHVGKIVDSKFESSLVYWVNYDAEDPSKMYQVAYNAGFESVSEGGTTLTEQEYNDLNAKYNAYMGADLKQIEGHELTLDNIESQLHIKFDTIDKEFIEFLLQKEESILLEKYAKIHLNDDDVSEYVVNELDYYLNIYVYDGNGFHSVSDGYSEELGYGTFSSTYYYYEKTGIISYFSLGRGGEEYYTVYKLNNNYELEHQSDCMYDEFEQNYGQLGELKDLCYEDVEYTNILDLVAKNINVDNTK